MARTALYGLDELGLGENDLKKFDSLLSRSHGVIFVTGPTGSGKSTTLASMIAHVNRTKSCHILTIEDPIEFLHGDVKASINQRELGLDTDSFNDALREGLRQDPDIIMVGEIRDLETAEIAVQASLTGHLVMSTLHTNTAIGAVTRLIDMGVEPFLIANAINIIVAQRLIRTLCPSWATWTTCCWSPWASGWPSSSSRQR